MSDEWLGDAIAARSQSTALYRGRLWPPRFPRDENRLMSVLAWAQTRHIPELSELPNCLFVELSRLSELSELCKLSELSHTLFRIDIALPSNILCFSC